MQRLALPAVLAAVLACALSPGGARPDATPRLTLDVPRTPVFASIAPGVQVMQDWHEEVFRAADAYWVRRDSIWYRARSLRATFVAADPEAVPRFLLDSEPGKYLHYRPTRGAPWPHRMPEREPAPRS